MSGVGAITTICGLVVGVLAVIGKMWLDNRNRAIENQPRSARTSTFNRGPNPTVRRGICELCGERGAPIRACQHAFHDSCYALYGNKCGICTSAPEKKPL